MRWRVQIRFLPQLLAMTPELLHPPARVRAWNANMAIEINLERSMSTAQMSATPRNRHAVIDYLAFSLLFASVSIAVAVALGGIVLLLAPANEPAQAMESGVSSSVQLSGNRQENPAPGR